MTDRPPKHLRRRGCELWRVITTNFSLQPHHIPILRTLCETADRLETCRSRLSKEGLTIKDRWNKLKPHPLVAAELAYRQQLTTIFNALGLDEGTVAEKAAAPQPGRLRAIPGGKRTP
jgi:P27 family predicted phage terminase small subunit